MSDQPPICRGGGPCPHKCQVHCLMQLTCADGGVCHHGCPGPESCFRQRSCVPFSDYSGMWGGRLYEKGEALSQLELSSRVARALAYARAPSRANQWEFKQGWECAMSALKAILEGGS